MQMQSDYALFKSIKFDQYDCLDPAVMHITIQPDRTLIVRTTGAKHAIYCTDSHGLGVYMRVD